MKIIKYKLTNFQFEDWIEVEGTVVGKNESMAVRESNGVYRVDHIHSGTQIGTFDEKWVAFLSARLFDDLNLSKEQVFAFIKSESYKSRDKWNKLIGKPLADYLEANKKPIYLFDNDYTQPASPPEIKENE